MADQVELFIEMVSKEEKSDKDAEVYINLHC